MIAGRLSDRGSVAIRCDQVRSLLDEATRLVQALWGELAEATTSVFPDAVGPDEILLTQAAQLFNEVAASELVFTSLAHTVPNSTGPASR